MFHTNSIEIMPYSFAANLAEKVPAGSILVCIRQLNTVLAFDRHSGKVLWWWGEGKVDYPHSASVLPSGNVLLFDNGAHRGFSRVFELNPVNGKIEWEYRADPPKAFFSKTRGSAQRLSNGNTLITDSHAGRAFEVTREGDVVWEYYSPLTAKNQGSASKRPVFYRVERYSLAAGAPFQQGKE